MIEEKIIELGFNLPEAPKPLAAYIPVIKTGNLVFTAGQVPISNGALLYKGKVGKELNVEDGQKAAQVCLMNALSVVKSEINNLDNIKRIIKVTVFVNSADGFTGQPQVANGASELLVEIFGEKGKHVRSAVGVNELPIDSAVEIELVVEV